MSKAARRSKKWIRSKQDEWAYDAGYYYDDAKAQRVVDFFAKFLRIPDRGTPFVLMPWQELDIIRPLFGWCRPDGRRRFTEGFIAIPKKNGKSMLLSGIAPYALVADGEHSPEVYIAASDRKQAGIIYKETSAMVKDSPQLARRMMTIDSRQRIDYPKEHGLIQVLSAEAFRAEGYKASMVMIDELHAQPDRKLYDALKYAGRSRAQPLLLSITTAGRHRQSICGELWDFADRVASGAMPMPSFFAAIYAKRKDEKPGDEDMWRRVNPSIGHCLSIEDMRADYKKAVHMPAEMASFLRYRCNEWVTGDATWIDLNAWDRCDGELDLSSLVGRECFAAMDMASTIDIAALCRYFPAKEPGERDAVVWDFWLPRETIAKREDKDRVPYATWARAGLFRVQEGAVIDQEAIKQDILRMHKITPLRELAYDRWNVSKLVLELEREGIKMVEFGQGFRDFTPACRELESGLARADFCHGGNAVARWMATNVVAEIDGAGNIKPTKAKSKEKIDGIVTLIMARYRASVAPKAAKKSFGLTSF